MDLGSFSSITSSATTFVENFLVFIILVTVLLAFAYRAGRSAFFALILSLYAGYALYSVFPYAKQFVPAGASAMVAFAVSAGLYIAMTGLVYVVMRRFASGSLATLHPLPLIVLTLLTAGFLMALGYHLFNIATIYRFPMALHDLFAPSQYFFYWFIAPLVGLFIFAR